MPTALSALSALSRSLYLWACERLYHELAPGYDAVSRVVSLGAWPAWRRTILPHLQGPRLLELGFGTGELLAELPALAAARELPVTAIVGLERSGAMHAVAHAPCGVPRSPHAFVRVLRARPRARVVGRRCGWARDAAWRPPRTGRAGYAGTRAGYAGTRAGYAGTRAGYAGTRAGYAGAACVQGCGEALPFAAGAFDTVFATFPAPYILAPATLAECARVLAPGGRLLIAGLWVRLRHARLRALVPLFYADPSPDQQAALAARVAAAGFAVQWRSEPVGWAEVPILLAQKP